MQTLDTVSEGETVRVVKVMGGMKIAQRLLEWGLVPDALVQVVFNNKHGPIIIKVNDVTIAIGRGIAKKILVDKVGMNG